MTKLDQLWPDAPHTPDLTSEQVHVWLIALKQAAAETQGLKSLLASEEIRRAERFHFDKDRKRFVIVRGFLRVILGRYLKLEPGQLRFVYGEYGKPALDPEQPTMGLSFNLSHTHGLALAAVTRERRLGIDLEHIRPIPEVDQIAERVFSPRENRMLQAAEAQKLELFFEYWTCKEAYLKARGEGLSFPLDQIHVDMTPSDGAPVLSVRGHPQETSRWVLRKLEPAQGYAAALAVEGTGWQLAKWRLRGREVL